jgi:hypothetical protein
VQGPDKVFRVEFLGARDESTACNNPTKLMVWKRRTARFLDTDSYVFELPSAVELAFSIARLRTLRNWSALCMSDVSKSQHSN